MILKILKLHNVYGFSDYVFEYKPGIVGLLGHVGSGKSGFGEVAQYFAITGRTPANIPSKDELINWGESKGYTELTVEQDGVEYVMKRHLHNSGITLSWEENGEKHKQKQKEAAATFESMLGMPAEVFYECCFVRQGNLWAILQMSTSERLAYFQRITGTIVAEKLRKLLQKHSSNLPQFPDRGVEIAECDRVIDSNNLAKKALEEQVATQAATIKEQFPQSMEEVVGILKGSLSETDHKAKVTEATQELERCKKAFQKYKESIVTELGEAPPEVEAPSETEAVLHRDWQTVWQPANKDKDKTEKELAEARTELEALTSTEQLQDNRKTAQKRLDKSVGALATLRANLRGVAAKIQLAEQGLCPTCNQQYPANKDDLETERADLHDQIQKLETVREQLVTYVADTDSNIRLTDNRARVLAGLIATGESLIAVCEDVRYQGYDPSDYTTRKEAALTCQTYTRKYRAYQDTRKARENAVFSRTATLQQCQERTYLSDTEKVRLEKYRDQLVGLLQQTQQAQQRIAEIQSVVTSQTTIRDAYQKDMNKQAKINRKRKIIEGTRDLLHRQRLPKVVMNHLRVSLAYEVHQQLRRFDMPYQAELNEDFDYVVHWADARDKGVHTLSGGQKVILSICHHLALARILADSIPVIFMDEPTNHLGDAEKSLVQKALYSMREHAGRNTPILVATHEEQLIPAFNSTVEFSRKSDT